MPTFQQRRCAQCQVRYSFQTSGYGGIQEDNHEKYCSSCFRVLQDALKAVPKRVSHAWVGTSDVSVESLVEQEQAAVDQSKAAGKLPVRRELSPLFDLERPSNQHVQGIVYRDGRTYRYEYWTEQGGMAAGRVYIEVERDTDGTIIGPWSLTDVWATPPKFIEHPPWPDRSPATHKHVPGVPMMTSRLFDLIQVSSKDEPNVLPPSEDT